MKTFQPYTIKNMTLKNKIVMPPMCMYSADGDGYVKNFHMAHYGARAIGGVGLIIVEATGVSPNGRISDNDLGLWCDEQIAGMKKLVDSLHEQDTKVAIQLNHAGRKYEGGGVQVGVSPIRFNERYTVPKELTVEEIKQIVIDFGQAAKRAELAGFDALELHGAHGYLINQFLSPMSNHRTDEYGGNPENRTRFLKEVLEQVHQNWTADKPVILRISATEYNKNGYSMEELADMLNTVSPMLDIIHVSSGGNSSEKIDIFPGYQVRLAEEIKKLCKKDTIAVGLIDNIDLAEEILGNQRADLVAIGRTLLRDPQFVLNEARRKGYSITLPKQYERGYK
ncbi:MAG: yqjM [Herbinix sp.]|jgi:NADPH2 dehydrogenase|nr:yqjM [Herbinix sp.]